jgi:nucleoid-associated protein EbfC
MFGDLMQKMEQQQADLKAKMALVRLSANVQGVDVVVNGNRELLQISIPEALTGKEEKEQLEDLLVVAINRALHLAHQQEALEAGKLASQMMPGGLGALGNMFK